MLHFNVVAPGGVVTNIAYAISLPEDADCYPKQTN